AAVTDTLSSAHHTTVDPARTTYAILERRLQKAVTANSKWQEKYEIETKAKLARRVRSWKAAYVSELERREALEKELFDTIQQASEMQAETYRKEIRRLAALLLCEPLAASPSRRSTPPGRGKRPPDRSLEGSRDDTRQYSTPPNVIFNAAGWTTSSEMPLDPSGRTRAGSIVESGHLNWRQRRLEDSAATAENEQERPLCLSNGREDEDGWQDFTRKERDSPVTGSAGGDVRDRINNTGMERVSVRRAQEDTYTPPSRTPSADRRPASVRRPKTKLAPGWGPSASAGRYAEAVGVSRLRLALQGGRSSISPQGTSARLALIRELSGDCEHVSVDQVGVAPKAADRVEPGIGLDEEGMRAVMDEEGSEEEALPGDAEATTAAMEPNRGGLRSSESAERSGALHGGSAMNGNDPQRVTNESALGENGLGMIEEDYDEQERQPRFTKNMSTAPFKPPRNGRNASPGDAGKTFPTISETMEEPVTDEQHQMEDQGQLNACSARTAARASFSPATHSGNGVAYRHRRRKALAPPPATPAPSAAPSASRRPGAGDDGHRRSPPSPLPPRPPRISSPTGARGIDDDEYATASSNSTADTPFDPVGSRVSEVESCGPGRKISASVEPLAAKTDAVFDSMATTIGGANRDCSSGSTRTSSVTTAQRGVYRAPRQRCVNGGVGGGRGEICAILGGISFASGCDGGNLGGNDDVPVKEHVGRYHDTDFLHPDIASAPMYRVQDEQIRADKCRDDGGTKPENPGGAYGSHDVEGTSVGGGIDGTGVLGQSPAKNILDPSEEKFDDGTGCGGGKGGVTRDESSGAAVVKNASAESCTSDKPAAFADSGSGSCPSHRGNITLEIENGLAHDITEKNVDIAVGSIEAGSPAPQQQPKPRIIELYRSRAASSNSFDESAASGNEEAEEGSLEISLGSSDDTTFAEMHASLGSLKLSESVSSGSEQSFSLGKPTSSCATARDASPPRSCPGEISRTFHHGGPDSGKRSAEMNKAEEDEDGVSAGEEGNTRLFESLLSIGIPGDWDLKSVIHPHNVAATNADFAQPSPVRAQATSRRTWGMNASSASTSVGGGGAGSWIRSVLSPSHRSEGKKGDKLQSSASAAPGSISLNSAEEGAADENSNAIASPTTPKTTPSSTAAGDKQTGGRGWPGDDGEDRGGGKPMPHESVSGRWAPQVLARYPPDATLPCDNVADYCFPQGVRAKAMDARESQSGLNKVFYQPGACQRGSQSFVFMFSGDHGYRGTGEAQSHRTYGVCVSYPKVRPAAILNRDCSSARDESGTEAGQDDAGNEGSAATPVPKLPATVPSPWLGEAGAYGTGPATKSQSPPRGRDMLESRVRTFPYDARNPVTTVASQVWGCYCLLSRFPFFDLHFQVLWDLLAAERIMRMKMTAKRRGKLTASVEAEETALLASRMDELLHDVSGRFILQPVPAPGKAVRLQVHPDLPEIRYQRTEMAEFRGVHQINIRSPERKVNIVSYDSFAGLRGDRIPQHVKDSREMIDAVAAWALPATLSLIPVDVLVAVLGALMCEYQVIVVSEDLGLLSSVVLALAALIRPLLWVHPLVPVMPMGMAEVLSAPVPYLIGTPRLEGGGERGDVYGPLSSGQILLDADDKRVIFAHEDDAWRTKLPRCRALLARLAPLAKVLGESCGGLKREAPLQLASGSQAAASEVVQATVSAHISAVCAGALRHRDEIVASTSTAASTIETKCSPSSSTTSDTSRSATATPSGGNERYREGRDGEALSGNGDDGDGGGGAGDDADPANGLEQHQMSKPASEEHGAVRPEEGEKQAIRQEGEHAGRNECSGDGCPPQVAAVDADTVAAASELPPAPDVLITTTTPGRTAATDGDDHGHWWEEDEEDEQESDEGDRVGAATSAINRLWTGSLVRADEPAQGGSGGKMEASRWLRRRGKDVYFLQSLVRSQAFEVYRAAAAEKS
ncbi:unnamed protein product, partial [Scytosiphon promiscuus]